MKELSIEEKAKRYDEAIERAKKHCADYVVETIFPELKESEDKKIKNDLIGFFKNENFLSHSNSEIVAWLERQGSEPNWCHHKVDLSNCSEEYCKAYYDGWNNCNMQHSQCKSELDDVVKCLINGMKFYYGDNEEATWGTDKWSMPVKHIIEVLERQVEQKSADIDNKFIRMRETKPKDISEFLDRLTTVEQEFLWEHVAKIRELDKDEQNHTDKVEPKFKHGDRVRNKKSGLEQTLGSCIEDVYEGAFPFHIKDQDNYELVEQKPAWSEEDETKKNNISHIIRQYDKISKRENKPCWYIGDCLLWMQNIKDRVQLQPKQEWSEEDENLLTDTEYLLRVIKMENRSDNEYQRAENCLAWLKSLRPQNRWKPSDEQMNALKKAIDSFTFEPDYLQELYEDLKKLKE